MNRLGIEISLIVALLLSCYGMYYFISENGKLEKENEVLEQGLEDTQNAIFELGQTIQNLTVKYSKVNNNEFDKFKKSDISKIPMPELVHSFNIGTRRVLKDYRNKTIWFIKGSTQTTTP